MAVFRVGQRVRIVSDFGATLGAKPNLTGCETVVVGHKRMATMCRCGDFVTNVLAATRVCGTTVHGCCNLEPITDSYDFAAEETEAAQPLNIPAGIPA